MDTIYSSRFFLGSNTGDGFCSLYDSLVRPADGDFLYIIKGGPGCGKSSFMKKLADTAERAGLSVQRFPCSGDPDSLDAVYFPERRLAYMDGTAPHVMEPDIFGAQAAYLDLGACCAIRDVRSEAKAVRELTAQYKRHYRAAYDALSAAVRLAPARLPQADSPDAADTARRRAASAVRRDTDGCPAGEGSLCRRFLSAFTWQGMSFCQETPALLCTRLRTVDEAWGLGSLYLSETARLALARGLEVIQCPDPICPDETQAVLLPQVSLGYVRSDVPSAGLPTRRVHLEELFSPEERRALRRREKLCRQIREEARCELSEAKSLHDLLEQHYVPHMDFAAADALAREHARLLLDNPAVYG